MRSAFRNLYWKLVSLAIAALLWFFFVGDPETMMSISAPIHYRNLPKELQISSDVPESVHLEVRGPAGKLAGATAESTLVILDLSREPQPGERTFTIRQHDVTLPAGVELARAVPSQLRLRFERRVEKFVAVQPRFAGPPPAGYRVSRTEVVPDRREILGPESRVQRIEYVETDPIDLSGVISETEFHVYCNTSDPLVTFNRSMQVNVKVLVEKIPQVR